MSSGVQHWPPFRKCCMSNQNQLLMIRGTSKRPFIHSKDRKPRVRGLYIAGRTSLLTVNNSLCDSWVSLANIGQARTGNPVNGGTGLLKCAFRASDDSKIFPFNIPSNAFVAAELSGTAKLIQTINPQLALQCSALSTISLMAFMSWCRKSLCIWQSPLLRG